MWIKTIPFALALLAGTSCAGHATSNAMSVSELASRSDRFEGKRVEVYGVVCDGIEAASVSLQPGPNCKDIAGINLQLGLSHPHPQLESHVLIVGRFIDTSLANPDVLNYRDNRYLGNFAIQVQELTVLGDGPNNSFKPNPLRGSA